MEHILSIECDAFRERTNTPRDVMNEHWRDVIESEFVERLGPAKWALRLVVPKEDADGND